MKLVYHDRYDLHLGEHVFPAQKYRLIRERLLSEGFASAEDFIAPEMASDEDMLRVHDEGWIRRLKTGTLTYLEILKLELPYSSKVIEGFWWATGGTILAARLALDDGIGFNVGGGFHHAFYAHGEGFCAVNDVAVAIRRIQHDGAIRRAMVIDTDVHQGNGTAALFAGVPDVFTLSIHQLSNYPDPKPPSTVDIHLADGTSDEEYLSKLRAAVEPVLNAFRPELVMFVSGADPYENDQLGGLSLTMDGLRRRDSYVMETALAHRAACAIVLAGGYAIDVEDTVTIHSNTAKAAQEALETARIASPMPRQIPG